MTDEEKEIYYDAMRQYEECKRERALEALFERYSINSDLKDYPFIIRIFIWVKTWICLKLKRTNGTYMDNHTICVLSYDEQYGMECQSWDACWCSTRLFSGWQVCLASDGT